MFDIFGTGTKSKDHVSFHHTVLIKGIDLGYTNFLKYAKKSASNV